MEESDKKAVDPQRSPLKKIECFDASKQIERTQSEATFGDESTKLLHPRTGSVDYMQLADKQKKPPITNVSERSRVYLDLSNIEGSIADDEDVVTPTSKNVRKKNMLTNHSKILMTTRGLETIKQENVADSVDGINNQLKQEEWDKDVSFELETGISCEQYERLLSQRGSIGEFEAGSVGPSSPDHLSGSDGASCFYTKYPLRFPHGYSLSKYRHNLKLSYQTLSQRLEQQITQIKEVPENESSKQLPILAAILKLAKEAWDTPVYGRDLAYSLCDIIRMEGLLDMLIKNCSSQDKGLLLASASLLEQVMSIRNRERVAKEGLEIMVKMTRDYAGDLEMARATTGILENMFKLSEETCTKVVNLGGLDVILRWCRCGTDYCILRRCAKALANLSLFGGAENQEIMSKHKMLVASLVECTPSNFMCLRDPFAEKLTNEKYIFYFEVPEWLFPLAFSDDNSIRYYACLAISALVANKELEASVIKSGTLDLVLPFINSNKPSQFAQSDITHKQGRDKIWLKHLIPLLFSRRQEAQALAAFHFAMEAIIKAEQGRQDIFHEIDAVEPLKKIAGSPNAVASQLAAEALKMIGEKIPHKLSQQVPLWTVDDVVYWVTQIGFEAYAHKFQEARVDGDLLLILTDEDLNSGLDMHSSILRKRFSRELKSLKITADYFICDPTGLDTWLMSLSPELSQYTYLMLRQGVDKYEIKSLSDEELKDVCGITNSVHRRRIMTCREELVTPEAPTKMPKPSNTIMPTIDPSLSINLNTLRSIDVFICYRRSSGSQLASLLKVHLQLRGFSVFLDIDRLRAGKFDENLLLSIQMSQHFVLILTPDALDRCIDDEDQEDWVHKEIVAALQTNCNIVPIIDNFEWPPLERLPMDMRGVVKFNCVRWVHEYQDACVDKLETFLHRGQPGHLISQNCSLPTSYGGSPHTGTPHAGTPHCLHLSQSEPVFSSDSVTKSYSNHNLLDFAANNS